MFLISVTLWNFGVLVYRIRNMCVHMYVYMLIMVDIQGPDNIFRTL